MDVQGEGCSQNKRKWKYKAEEVHMDKITGRTWKQNEKVEKVKS